MKASFRKQERSWFYFPGKTMKYLLAILFIPILIGVLSAKESDTRNYTVLNRSIPETMHEGNNVFRTASLKVVLPTEDTGRSHFILLCVFDPA